MKPWPLLSLLFLGVSPTWAGASGAWTTEASAAVGWDAVEDDAGGFYLLWTRPEGAGVRLLGQHVAADGAALWPVPGQSLEPVVADSSSWSAFADSHQGLMTTWVQDGKVWLQAWSPGGQPQWQTPLRLSDPRFVASSPVGVADGAGGAYVVWAEKMYADRTVLLAQHVSAQSAPIWPTAVRVSLRPSNQRQPAVAFDRAAGLMVSWTDAQNLASSWRVQRINYQGFRLWGLEGLVITSPAGIGHSALRMVPWGQGSLTVAWSEGRAGHLQALSRQITPQGKILAENWTPPPPTSDQWNPVLTGSGLGQFWLGWEDNRNARHWQIYVRNGRQDIPLAPSVGDQGRLTLAEDDELGAFAAWIDNRRGGAAIYGQRINAAGQPLWERAGRALIPSVKRPDAPLIRFLGTNRLALIWADHPKPGSTELHWRVW